MNMNDASIHQRASSSSQSANVSNTSRLEARREARATKKKANRVEAEKIKNDGNDLYKKGLYPSAVSKYEEALIVGGTNPLILSNIAAAFLQMECFEDAEECASRVLEHDPTSVKARYRRGQARYALKRFRGAMLDFEAALSGNPSDREVKKMVGQAKNALKRGAESTESDQEYDKTEYGAPDRKEGGYESDVYSDSSDSRHIGDGAPCYSYNHGGCDLGGACPSSHSYDGQSVRDDVGRNVCLYFLLDRCKRSEDKCPYSHDKLHLPAHGWWNDPSLIQAINNRETETSVVRHQFSGPFCRYELSDDETEAHKATNTTSKKRLRSNLSGCNVPTSPFFLVISLEYVDYISTIHKHLFSALEAKAHVKLVKTSTAALLHLDSPDILGIIIADAGVSRAKHGRILRRIIAYAKRGGTVVVGGQFSNNMSLDTTFFEAWGLPWTIGDYHRTTLYKKETHNLVKLNPSLPNDISIKAVHIAGLEPGAGMYLPTNESRLESRVFPNIPIQNVQESPLVHVRIGDGFFGYVGDVNGEPECTPIVLSMLGYLDDKPPSMSVAPVDHATTSSQETFILLLSLENFSFFDEIHTHLLSGLRSKTRVEQASTANDATKFLSSPNLRAVLVVDPGITSAKHSRVSQSLHKFVHDGGIAVFAGLFSSFISPPDMKKFWSTPWNLSWQMGSYGRRDFDLQSSAVAGMGENSLTVSYSMKAVSLQGIEKKHAVYLESENSGNGLEAPVVRARVGKGYLGYLGDVNAEEESTAVVLTLLGLNV